MKEHTVKLSGYAKDRFLERFFAEEDGLDGETRQRLVTRSKSALTSLRVRKAVLSGQRRVVPKAHPGASPSRPADPVELATSAASPAVPTPARTPPPATTSAPLPDPAPEAQRPAEATRPAVALQVTDSAPFDAFAVKLVPVFQREGREGLLAKLADVATVDHLRQMAKAQQVVLPQALRTGEADAQTVRVAIADAVAKRVADRRAAAG